MALGRVRGPRCSVAVPRRLPALWPRRRSGLGVGAKERGCAQELRPTPTLAATRPQCAQATRRATTPRGPQAMSQRTMRRATSASSAIESRVRRPPSLPLSFTGRADGQLVAVLGRFFERQLTPEVNASPSLCPSMRLCVVRRPRSARWEQQRHTRQPPCARQVGPLPSQWPACMRPSRPWVIPCCLSLPAALWRPCARRAGAPVWGRGSKGVTDQAGEKGSQRASSAEGRTPDIPDGEPKKGRFGRKIQRTIWHNAARPRAVLARAAWAPKSDYCASAPLGRGSRWEPGSRPG